MGERVRDRVPELTGLLTVVSLALVFGAVLGAVPRWILPRASDAVLAAIPTVNAVVSVLAIAAIALGWYWVRRGRVERHRRAMLSATALFLVFLVLYLYRIVLVGPTEFTGPAAVRRFVYLPVLAVHVLLAIASIPLVYYVLLLALTHPVRTLRETNHPRVGRVAASLWLVSFTLGLVVYTLLYHVF